MRHRGRSGGVAAGLAALVGYHGVGCAEADGDADEPVTALRARVHDYNDPIHPSLANTLVSKRGEIPDTWGDGVGNRIGGQNGGYRRTHPSGSPVVGWDGN